MALRSDELHYNLQHLQSMLTAHEAAKYLDLSYWHFMHLVEAGRIPGLRVVDRWLFSPTDLNEYQRSRYGKLEDMATLALDHPGIGLTEKQAVICRYLASRSRPSDIARTLHQSRQAVHAQISLIREKVARVQLPQSTVNNPKSAKRLPRTKQAPIPLRPPNNEASTSTQP